MSSKSSIDDQIQIFRKDLQCNTLDADPVELISAIEPYIRQLSMNEKFKKWYQTQNNLTDYKSPTGTKINKTSIDCIITIEKRQVTSTNDGDYGQRNVKSQ